MLSNVIKHNYITNKITRFREDKTEIKWVKFHVSVNIAYKTEEQLHMYRLYHTKRLSLSGSAR